MAVPKFYPCAYPFSLEVELPGPQETLGEVRGVLRNRIIGVTGRNGLVYVPEGLSHLDLSDLCFGPPSRFWPENPKMPSSGKAIPQLLKSSPRVHFTDGEMEAHEGRGPTQDHH